MKIISDTYRQFKHVINLHTEKTYMFKPTFSLWPRKLVKVTKNEDEHAYSLTDSASTKMETFCQGKKCVIMIN